MDISREIQNLTTHLDQGYPAHLKLFSLMDTPVMRAQYYRVAEVLVAEFPQKDEDVQYVLMRHIRLRIKEAYAAMGDWSNERSEEELIRYIEILQQCDSKDFASDHIVRILNGSTGGLEIKE